MDGHPGRIKNLIVNKNIGCRGCFCLNKYYFFVVSLTFVLIFLVGDLYFCLKLPCFIFVFTLVVSGVDFEGVDAETVPKQIAAKAIIQSTFFMIDVFSL
jgi:hypothetical protein